MVIEVKINPEKVTLALLREGYGNIAEFAKKAKMSSGTITKALREHKCSYKTAFKLADNLGVSAEEFVVTE